VYEDDGHDERSTMEQDTNALREHQSTDLLHAKASDLRVVSRRDPRLSPSSSPRGVPRGDDEVMIESFAVRDYPPATDARYDAILDR